MYCLLVVNDNKLSNQVIVETDESRLVISITSNQKESINSLYNFNINELVLPDPCLVQNTHSNEDEHETDDVKKLVVDDHAVPQLVCSTPQLSSNLINGSSKESKNNCHDNVIKTNNMHTEKITLDLSVVCISQFF